MIISYKVPNFSKVKHELLKLIKKIPETPFVEGTNKISHTDYLIENKQEEYSNYFFKNVLPGYHENLKRHLGINAIYLSNLWFQIYRKGDFHGKHTHEKTHFTNVFYICLPNKKLITKINKPKPEIIDAEEGTIITFPGFYEHESPVNNTEDEKIIISFNIDIHSYLD